MCKKQDMVAISETRLVSISEPQAQSVNCYDNNMLVSLNESTTSSDPTTYRTDKASLGIRIYTLKFYWLWKKLEDMTNE